MQKENNDKNIRFLGGLFVIVSVFYVFYAACSLMGLYFDGAFYFLHIFENILNNKFSFCTCDYHPRAISQWVLEFPTLFSGIVLGIKSKTTLATIYSFTLISLPLIALWWNYELTKRTKETGILFWSVFTYCLFILACHINSSAELLVGIPFQFVLLNYLYGKIDYTKADKIGIACILLLMFGIYEHTIFLGLIIFAGMFIAAFNELNGKNMIVKIWIGAGSLASAFYSFFFLIFHSVKKTSLINFVLSSVSVLPDLLNICAIFSLITLILVPVTSILNQTKANKLLILFFSFPYVFLFTKMLSNLNVYINPVEEAQTKGLLFIIVVLIFLGIVLSKYGFLNGLKINKEIIINNAYIPVLLCGIFLTAWQIVNTYYWNENIAYLKEEINYCNSSSEYEEKAEEKINLNRYIVEGNDKSIRTLIDEKSAINNLYYIKYCNNSKF